MKRLTAAEIMNREIVTVRDDVTVHELATLLTDREISGAPVEDRQGNLIGVVSVTDIARSASEGGPSTLASPQPDFFGDPWQEQALDLTEIEDLHVEEGDLLVRDIMTPQVYTIDERATVGQIARDLMAAHLHRLLVVREGRVVGIISTSDLLQLLADRA
jgi:CBS domain-containing protein